jgi:hypothetical protein
MNATIHKLIRTIAITVGLLGVISPAARATDLSWTNTAGGTFSSAGNWNPNSFPVSPGDTATFGLTGGYQVNFTSNASSDKLTITNSNTVTFDMAGKTYTASITANNPGIVIGGTAKLILSDSVGTNGLLRNLAVANNVPISIGGSGLEMNTSLGFGTTFTIHGDFNALAPILVTGAGSVLNHDQSFFNVSTGSSLTITNGGRVNGANFQQVNNGAPIVIDGVGSLLKTTANGARVGQFGGTVNIKNGGTWDTSGLQFEMGVSSGNPVITVGNGVNTSSIFASDFRFGTTFDPNRGAPELIVKNGGLIRATSTANSIFIYDQGTLTMNGGIAEVAAGGQVVVADINGTGAKGLLRGSGTLTRYLAGSNFSITNNGSIRPGDTNATARIGTLSVVNGDLVQYSGGTLFDDLGAGGIGDFIDISGGAATIGGTNLISFGAYTPQVGDKWELLRADTITYTAVNNIAAALTPFGLQSQYSLFILPDDGTGRQGLFLSIPEPSAVALLGLAGLLFIRKRAQR